MQNETGSIMASTVERAYRVAPGTETLIDENNNDYLHHLQHANVGDGKTLLVPQPSLTDPNDPLRWPGWKKWLVSTSKSSISKLLTSYCRRLPMVYFTLSLVATLGQSCPEVRNS
jgi:hypothetical protein